MGVGLTGVVGESSVVAGGRICAVDESGVVGSTGGDDGVGSSVH